MQVSFKKLLFCCLPAICAMVLMLPKVNCSSDLSSNTTNLPILLKALIKIEIKNDNSNNTVDATKPKIEIDNDTIDSRQEIHGTLKKPHHETNVSEENNLVNNKTNNGSESTGQDPDKR